MPSSDSHDTLNHFKLNIDYCEVDRVLTISISTHPTPVEGSISMAELEKQMPEGTSVMRSYPLIAPAGTKPQMLFSVGRVRTVLCITSDEDMEIVVNGDTCSVDVSRLTEPRDPYERPDRSNFKVTNKARSHECFPQYQDENGQLEMPGSVADAMDRI